MTDVKELTFRGSDKTALYACGKCGLLYSPTIYACREDRAHEAAKNAATECCATRHCACGAALESRSFASCALCHEKAKLALAKIVSRKDYSGPVFSDDADGDWSEGYSSSIEALLEYCQDNDLPAPVYCQTCESVGFQLDVSRIMKSALDEHHEDAADQVVDEEGLEAFIKAWNAKQKLTSYYPKYSEVIVLDAERFAALIVGAA